MYRAQHESERRRGLILVVVLFMLTLFAIAGISLVLYADAESNATRLHRDASAFPQPDMEPELAFSYFLGQLLYDCLDDETGIYSALRGHSLMRNMYGLHTEFNAARNQWELKKNYEPYSGPGRLHTGPGSYLNPFGIDDFLLPNHMFHRADNFIRHPERYGTQVLAGPGDPRGPYIACSVGYTYPDLNTLFLAAARADGTVLMPSFFRPYTPFGPMGSVDATGRFIPNPNWFDTTNRALKYMVLRPRPADHLGFPPPEDISGDVKNWPWAPGGNDSIWIDIDAPVLKAPDGRKYKMLVAPLIIDLDSRLNVNVHGNVQGVNFDHRSNQGLGLWEASLARVLNADPNEWKNLIRGRPYNAAPDWLGRFGANRRADATALAPGLPPRPPPPTPHRHAALDFDGRNEANGLPTGRPQLPAAGGPGAFSVFPTFPAGYGNISAAELTDHPMFFNPFKGAGASGNDDRVFGPHNLAGLLRVFDTGSEALHGNDLIRMLPRNLNNPADPPGSARRRRLLTTTSFDLDRPGVAPWVWDRRTTSSTLYRYDATRGYPIGPAIPFPDPAQRTGTPPNSEFNPESWRSQAAALGRLDLNRFLSPYPPPDPTTGRITNTAAYAQAYNDRKEMAKEIFVRLQLLTGTLPLAGLSRTSDEFRALRWLAQLAVNIVDYIDEDDYVTHFHWNDSDFVYGTELPRLVLNEAYVQQNADPSDATRKQGNVWVELHNPFTGPPAETTLTNNSDAVLQLPAVSGSASYAAYRIVLTRRNNNLRAPDNVTGDPDPGTTIRTLTSWGADPAKWVVRPSNGSYSGPAGGNQGFYVVGPDAAFPAGANPSLPSTLLSPSMNYPTEEGQPVTVLLRRLLCPHLPENTSTTAATYNPYVTVDYMEDVPVNDAGTVAVGDRAAHGKNQPYAAHVSQRAAQAPALAGAGQPKHTFYRHNAVEATAPPAAGPGQTLKVPFDWLVHLDRQLVSPVELLHVSAFKPHELTQQFVGPSTAAPAVIGPFQHYAPWFERDTRIARLFGLVTTKNRLVDTVVGGRIPGRVNLNTLFDEEVFQAVCDAGPSNSFTAADVRAAWLRLLARRTPSGVPGPVGVSPSLLPPGILRDRPLLDAGTGLTTPGGLQHPDGGISLADTLLSPGLFFDSTSTAHPYLKYELLSKIWNNVTVRSNVFAVWLTVGFFEVMDDSTKPVKLGPEIGRAENRHIRHRMFAVVDRTNATVFTYPLRVHRIDGSPSRPVQVQLAFPPGPQPFSGNTPGGLRWEVQEGTPLVFDPDMGNEETTVIDRTLAPDQFWATFRQTHLLDARIIGRGNIGPWRDYNPRSETRVVPYWAIID